MLAVMLESRKSGSSRYAISAMAAGCSASHANSGPLFNRSKTRWLRGPSTHLGSWSILAARSACATRTRRSRSRATSSVDSTSATTAKPSRASASNAASTARTVAPSGAGERAGPRRGAPARAVARRLLLRIAADDPPRRGRRALLAATADTGHERLERGERIERVRVALDDGDVHEAVAVESEGAVAQALGPLRGQLVEHRSHQPLVLVGGVGSRPVAHDHGAAHGSARMRLLRASWVTSASPNASSNGGMYMPNLPRY